MPNQEKNQNNGPIFRLQKLYVKDLSFENPNAPEIYLQKGEPKVEINLSSKNTKVDDDHWEVALSVTVTVTSGEKTLFIVEIEHAGLFLLKNIPEQHLGAVLAVECPTVLFPFTRQIISQVSVDGGFIPFLLEPVNFLALYENAKRKREQEKKSN